MIYKLLCNKRYQLSFSPTAKPQVIDKETYFILLLRYIKFFLNILTFSFSLCMFVLCFSQSLFPSLRKRRQTFQSIRVSIVTCSPFGEQVKERKTGVYLLLPIQRFWFWWRRIDISLNVLNLNMFQIFAFQFFHIAILKLVWLLFSSFCSF